MTHLDPAPAPFQPVVRASFYPAKQVVAGVDRAQVRRFVEVFYDQVRPNAVIGPIFQRVVADGQWPAHYETMTDFWMAVAFNAAPFRGNPMVKHAQIRDIAPAHFDIWLSVFESAARSFWPAEIAELLIFRAHQIAPALIRSIDRAREKSLVTDADLH
jgi:hemoglobin